MARCKNTEGTRAGTFMFFLLAWILFLASYAGPYWTVQDTSHHGLWQFCNDPGGCATHLGYQLQPWQVSCQALATIALICDVCAFAVYCAWWAVRQKRLVYGPTYRGVVAMMLTLLGGCLSVTVAGVWGGKTANSDILGWGWYLQMISGLISFVNGLTVIFVFSFANYKPMPPKKLKVIVKPQPRYLKKHVPPKSANAKFAPPPPAEYEPTWSPLPPPTPVPRPTPGSFPRQGSRMDRYTPMSDAPSYTVGNVILPPEYTPEGSQSRPSVPSNPSDGQTQASTRRYLPNNLPSFRRVHHPKAWFLDHGELPSPDQWPDPPSELSSTTYSSSSRTKSGITDPEPDLTRLYEDITRHSSREALSPHPSDQPPHPHPAALKKVSSIDQLPPPPDEWQDPSSDVSGSSLASTNLSNAIFSESDTVHGETHTDRDDGLLIPPPRLPPKIPLKGRTTPDSRASDRHRQTPDSRASDRPRQTPDSRTSDMPRQTPDSRAFDMPRQTPDSRDFDMPRQTPDSRSSRRSRHTPDVPRLVVQSPGQRVTSPITLTSPPGIPPKVPIKDRLTPDSRQSMKSPSSRISSPDAISSVRHGHATSERPSIQSPQQRLISPGATTPANLDMTGALSPDASVHSNARYSNMQSPAPSTVSHRSRSQLRENPQSPVQKLMSPEPRLTSSRRQTPDPGLNIETPLSRVVSPSALSSVSSSTASVPLPPFPQTDAEFEVNLSLPPMVLPGRGSSRGRRESSGSSSAALPPFPQVETREALSPPPIAPTGRVSVSPGLSSSSSGALPPFPQPGVGGSLSPPSVGPMPTVQAGRRSAQRRPEPAESDLGTVV